MRIILISRFMVFLPYLRREFEPFDPVMLKSLPDTW